MPSRRVWPIFCLEGIRKQVAFKLCLQEKKRVVRGKVYHSFCNFSLLPWQAKGGLKESQWGQSTGKGDQRASTGGSRWYRSSVNLPQPWVAPNLASFPEEITRQDYNVPKEESWKGGGNIWEICTDRKIGQMTLFFKGEIWSLETKI